MQPDIAHQCCDQLTAVRTGYPLISITLPYRGLKCRLIEVEYFFEVIRWQITSFKWSQAQVYLFLWFIWNMLCLCHCGPVLLRFWFQTDLGRENSASFLKILAAKTFSYHGHASLSTSNFYALIGQNSTGELMWEIYAASWKLFTLTAEADRVLCQLVMFLTVFFHWMYKMKSSCYQEAGLFIGFWLRKRRLSKFGNPIANGIVFVFHLA